MITDENNENDRLRAIFETMSRSEDDDAWEQIANVHRTGGPDSFATCAAWLRSEHSLRRQVAIRVLAQLDLRHERGVSSKAVTDALAPLLDTETDSALIEDLISAFGHRKVSPGKDYLRRAARHASADVRFSVAIAAPAFPTDEALPLLLELSADRDPDVRNWATFGIGTQLDEYDSEEMRNALIARLDDEDDDARLEAVVGLARRGDRRVTPYIRRELRGESVFSLAVEAADLIRDASLLPDLEAAADNLGGDDDIAKVIARIEGSSDKAAEL